MNWKLGLALLVALLLLVFTAQNAEVVEVRFLFWTLETSRAIVLFSVLGAGIGIGLALSGLAWLSHPD